MMKGHPNPLNRDKNPFFVDFAIVEAGIRVSLHSVGL